MPYAILLFAAGANSIVEAAYLRYCSLYLYLAIAVRLQVVFSYGISIFLQEKENSCLWCVLAPFLVALPTILIERIEIVLRITTYRRLTKKMSCTA